MENAHAKILGKMKRSYGATKKKRMFLNRTHLKILYYSMMQSNIEYCLNTWCHGNTVIVN